jgi:lysine-arginine-ornithine-binding protein
MTAGKIFLALVALVIGFGSAGAADKVIRIGTEAADAPFEYRDSDGALKGLEIELAAAMCAKMKAECVWVNQDFDSLIPALQAHKIDAAMSQMSVTADRKKAVDFTDIVTIGPARYVAPVGSTITEDPKTLQGKTVGVESGTTHERYVTERLKGIATAKVYQSQEEAYLDLEAGGIDATLGDQTLSYDWLQKHGRPRFDFAGGQLDDPDIFGAGTAIAVRKGDDELRKALNEALAAIIADGTYDRITKSYFPFSLRPGDQPSGTPDSDWPEATAQPAAMSSVWDYAGEMGKGVLLTLELALTTLFFGVLLGLLGAGAKLSANPWVNLPVTLLTNLIRGVPDFLLVLIAYFAVPQFLSELTGRSISLDPFAAGVLALSVVFGAYASEVFRGAFLAVPKGQMEAARAFGMRPAKAFLRIRLPQAWRFALPSLGNQWQSLLKDTALVSLVGLQELMKSAQIGANNTKLSFVFYFAASLLFLGLWAISTPIFGALERRASRGVRRAR